MHFKQKIAEGFHAQGFMHFLGATLQKVEEGYVEIEVPFKKEISQQHGLFHGGVVATLADNASGFAANTLMNENEQPLTIEFKINLIAKASGSTLIAKGRVLRNGRRIKVCQSEVFCINNGKSYQCAVALVSIIATEENLK